MQMDMFRVLAVGSAPNRFNSFLTRGLCLQLRLRYSNQTAPPAAQPAVLVEHLLYSSEQMGERK